jgi:hypothetical protein
VGGPFARRRGVWRQDQLRVVDDVSICRKFLSEHALKKAVGETPGNFESKPVSPAQMLYAKEAPNARARARWTDLGNRRTAWG